MVPWSMGHREMDLFLEIFDLAPHTAFWYQNNIEIPFFNYYLKGKGEDPKLSEATIFLTGENQWKNFDQWPPANVSNQPIYFQSNGNLSWSKPTDKKACK